jgi:hypothetical protein
MSATVSGENFIGTLVSCTIGKEQAENILDAAVDLLMLYGGETLSIGHLSGAPGSKTLTVPPRTRAAIYLAARAIYQSDQREVAGEEPSAATINLLSNPSVLTAVKEAVTMLKSQAESINWADAII